MMELERNFTIKEPDSNDDVAVLRGCITILGMGFSFSVFVALGEYGVFVTIEWRRRLAVEFVGWARKWRFFDRFDSSPGGEELNVHEDTTLST